MKAESHAHAAVSHPKCGILLPRKVDLACLSCMAFGIRMVSGDCCAVCTVDSHEDVQLGDSKSTAGNLLRMNAPCCKRSRHCCRRLQPGNCSVPDRVVTPLLAALSRTCALRHLRGVRRRVFPFMYALCEYQYIVYPCCLRAAAGASQHLMKFALQAARWSCKVRGSRAFRC